MVDIITFQFLVLHFCYCYHFPPGRNAIQKIKVEHALVEVGRERERESRAAEFRSFSPSCLPHFLINTKTIHLLFCLFLSLCRKSIADAAQSRQAGLSCRRRRFETCCWLQSALIYEKARWNIITFHLMSCHAKRGRGCFRMNLLSLIPALITFIRSTERS
jgi:hypothetical protein